MTSVNNTNNPKPNADGKLQWDPIDSFDNMDLSEDLLRGVYAFGYEKPSMIQQLAIQPIIKGHDVVAQAQSGTGKTATFAISLLSRVNISHRECQAIVMAPTRELASQIGAVIKALGDRMGVRVSECVGGRNVRENINELRDGVHVAVGTPGRLFDLIQRRRLNPEMIKMFILDEADEMLSYGFKDQIHDVFKFMPDDVQVGLFSATLPAEVMEVTKRFMRDPVNILVKEDELTLDGIKQYYVACDTEEFKLPVMFDLYESLTVTQAIIFCKSRRAVDWLTAKMDEQDFTVSPIHGDMEQAERNLVMREFKSGSSRVLIATDCIARGIDVQGVSHVFNFDLPSNRENYIHRIGRSGRFGRKGVAISLVTQKDAHCLRDIEKFYNTEIKELPDLLTLM